MLLGCWSIIAKIQLAFHRCFKRQYIKECKHFWFKLGDEDVKIQKCIRFLVVFKNFARMGLHSHFYAPINNIADNATYHMIDYLVSDKLNVFVAGPPSLHITLNHHKV